MTLPRPLLLWLRTLDLTYPIKNPKRDFANGYLIAEILSRYYPDEEMLDLRRFYTGLGTWEKSENWSWLRKFFQKQGLLIPEEAVQAVLRCQEGAVEAFLEGLYGVFTGAKIQRPDDAETALCTSDIPRYALPTTSEIIRRVADNPAKAEEIVQGHKRWIRRNYPVKVESRTTGTQDEAKVRKSEHAVERGMLLDGEWKPLDEDISVRDLIGRVIKVEVHQNIA
ncbi:spermatogenesis-associated protein 4 [Gaertneriomyces sp. JEL0708]|nr:spermatogenesis-associated protein 4 [Gaertneriomyces sp. JEL0708]